MNIGNAYRRARKMCKIKVKKDCLWKQRTHKLMKTGDSVRFKLYR